MPSSRPSKPRPHTRRLRCEALEDRRVLTVYMVDSVEDSGPGTLREAIDLANANDGPDEIIFETAVFSTPQTIAIDSQLPTITDPVTIAGPGADLLTVDAQHGADGETATGDGWRILEVSDGFPSTDMLVGLSGLTLANADHDGPGGAILNLARLTVDAVVFEGNHVWGEGGAVYDVGILDISRSRFIDNAAGSGGALYTRSASVATTLFESNNAFRGGAIYATGSARLVDSAIVSNTATYGAGAWITGRVAIEGVTVSGNRADEGAAFVFNGTGFGGSTVSHSTIVRNINLKTFSSLGAAYSAAIGLDPPFIGGESGRVRFTNSIVAETVDGDGAPASDVTAGPFSFTHSLLGTGNPAFDGINGNRIGGTNEDRLLAGIGPLDYYGGPTPTHPLLAGSPALDAGDPTITPDGHDQRGAPYARVADGGGGLRVDMGAYESQAPPPEARLGDFNADGRFDATDYTLWRDNRGATVAPFTLGDATGDGVVDAVDLNQWRARYGERYFVAPEVVVNDLGDDDDGDIFNGVTTLREAIRYANEDGRVNTISFDQELSGRTITIGWELRSYDHLTIDASNLAERITIDAGRMVDGEYEPGYWRIFGVGEVVVDPQVEYDLTLVGLDLIGGGGPATIDNTSWGTTSLIDTTVSQSRGSAVSNWGPVELIDSKVYGASSNQYFGDGAVQSQIGVTLLRSEIRDVDRGGIMTGFPRSYRLPTTPRTQEEYDPYVPRISLVDSIIAEVNGSPAISGTALSFAFRFPSYISLHRSHIASSEVGIVGGGVTLVNSSIIDGAAAGNAAIDAYDAELVDSFVTYTMSGEATDQSRGSGIIANGDVTLDRSRVENSVASSPPSSSWTLGGGIYAGGTVSLVDSVVAGNSAGRGGGIYALGQGENGAAPEPGTLAVSLLGSAVDDNTSQFGGSGIESFGSIRIEQSSVSRNTSLERSYDSLDAAVLYSGYTPEDTFEVIDSVVAGNRFVREDGSTFREYALGGISRAAVTLIDSHVIDNEANGVLAGSVTSSIISRNEGTGVVAGSTDLTVTGSTISGNRIGVAGGGTVRLIDTTVRGNRNVYSEPIYDNTNGAGVVADRVYLDRSTVAQNVFDTNGLPGNPSYNGGAGIAAFAVIFTTDSTIRDNQTRGTDVSGGGITADWITLHRTTVSGNTTEGLNAHGGGISARRSLTLTQSTVSGNRTLGPESHGGGIYAGELISQSSTIADNSTADTVSEGGGIFLTGDQFFESTIIAGNSAALGPDVRSDGEGNQIFRNSLISDASGFTIHEAADSLIDADPLLGPLMDNGGPTFTHALLEGSSAINAGDPSRTAIPFNSPFGPYDGLTDQRGDGFPRVTDGGVPGVYRIDIGAVEFPGETAPIDPPAAAIASLATRTGTLFSAATRAKFGVPVEASDTDRALLLISDDAESPAEDDHVRSEFDAESESPSDETLDEALAGLL